MTGGSNFVTEFLSETNSLISDLEQGTKLYDIISPIKNLMLNEKDLLAFSMARYCGANTQLAFFCEWSYQSLQLTKNPSKLVFENKEYFYKKVPIRLRGVPNIYKLVDLDVEIFVPHQIALIQNKSKSLLDKLVLQYPFLSKYLNENYLNRSLSSLYISHKNIYTERMSVSEYLESQMNLDSFIKIGLPCLLGFCFNFHQLNSTVNPESIKWGTVEEVLKNISLLNQINHNKEFESFVHCSSLNEKDEFEYLQLDQKSRLDKVLSTSTAKEVAKNHKEKIYKSTINTINVIDFPKEYKQMMLELLDWSYATNN